MRFTFLGTADAGRVPLYGCECPACNAARTQVAKRRGPCSALLETDQTRILLDAGWPDLDERFPVGPDAILLTHFHMDHVAGLFHIRWGVGTAIPVFTPNDNKGCDDLYKHPGLLDFRTFPAPFESQTIGDINVTPLPLNHSKPCYGYLITHSSGVKIAYLTDTIGLPNETCEFLIQQNLSLLVLDCTHPPQPSSAKLNHNDWLHAQDIIKRIPAERTFLTHISHGMDCWLRSNQAALSGVEVARDNLAIEFKP
ncbi:MAG: phosphonate metabolism protein PhnP [Pseudomonadales bacterium]|nr:phosphonate metabolism protein PhnP [Pseudomonadales bacterium]